MKLSHVDFNYDFKVRDIAKAVLMCMGCLTEYWNQ